MSPLMDDFHPKKWLGFALPAMFDYTFGHDFICMAGGKEAHLPRLTLDLDTHGVGILVTNKYGIWLQFFHHGES